MGGIPAFVTLTVSLFRMLKFERYIHGFKILNKVIDKSQGVLMVGGFASLVIVVFSSTIMYYAERNNPDPNMSKYVTYKIVCVYVYGCLILIHSHPVPSNHQLTYLNSTPVLTLYHL